MSLAARNIVTVPNIKVGQTKPFTLTPANAKKEVLLQHANQNTMVGILSQLSALAALSHDLFSNLTQEVTQVFTRTVKLAQRVEYTQKSLDVVEQIYANMTVETFSKKGRAEFATPTVSDAQLFTTETLPNTIKKIYDEIPPPPPLQKMDQFMEDGKKCLELYTNPRFFLDEWIQEQIKQRQAAKEARKKRIEERKARKQNEPKNRTALGTAQPARLQRAVYDPVTGERVTLPTQSVVDLRPNNANAPVQSTLRVPSSPTIQQKGAGSSFFSSPPPPSNVSFDDPPPPPPDFEFAPPPPPEEYQLPPPPETGDVALPPPPPAAFSINPQIKQTPLLVSRSPVPTRISQDSAPTAPPPPPQNLPAAPPPPPMGALGQGAPPPSGNLLSELRNKSLKTVQVTPSKPVDARSTLLEGIKSGIALKSAQERKVTELPVKKEEQPTSVAEILARRIAIQGSDSEDEDEDGGDWE